MEKIEVKNFGPITQVVVKVKDIDISIGTTSSGKSTLAKLISIFQNEVFESGITFIEFHNLLADYNIDFTINKDTFIRYEKDDFVIELKNNAVSSNLKGKARETTNPIYIPAERLFFSTISQSIFGLMSSNISLPKWIIDFGAKFEKARNSLKKLPVNFLNVAYEYDERTDYIQLPNKSKIKLSQASSGLQSVIPLLLVIEYNTGQRKKERNLFVIEEPELNLYPSSQKEFAEYIISKLKKSGDRLIITTHSPYLLTTLDNLIQAENIKNLRPDSSKKVNALVPDNLQINYDKVSCYFFDEGTGYSTMDDETKSIGPSNIDNVSEKLSLTFENLLALKYPN